MTIRPDSPSFEDEPISFDGLEDVDLTSTGKAKEAEHSERDVKIDAAAQPALKQVLSPEQMAHELETEKAHDFTQLENPLLGTEGRRQKAELVVEKLNQTINTKMAKIRELQRDASTTKSYTELGEIGLALKSQIAEVRQRIANAKEIHAKYVEGQEEGEIPSPFVDIDEAFARILETDKEQNIAASMKVGVKQFVTSMDESIRKVKMELEHIENHFDDINEAENNKALEEYRTKMADIEQQISAYRKSAALSPDLFGAESPFAQMEKAFIECREIRARIENKLTAPPLSEQIESSSMSTKERADKAKGILADLETSIKTRFTEIRRLLTTADHKLYDQDYQALQETSIRINTLLAEVSQKVATAKEIYAKYISSDDDEVNNDEGAPSPFLQIDNALLNLLKDIDDLDIPGSIKVGLNKHVTSLSLEVQKRREQFEKMEKELDTEEGINIEALEKIDALLTAYEQKLLELKNAFSHDPDVVGEASDFAKVEKELADLKTRIDHKIYPEKVQPSQKVIADATAELVKSRSKDLEIAERLFERLQKEQTVFRPEDIAAERAKIKDRVDEVRRSLEHAASRSIGAAVFEKNTPFGALRARVEALEKALSPPSPPTVPPKPVKMSRSAEIVLPLVKQTFEDIEKRLQTADEMLKKDMDEDDVAKISNELRQIRTELLSDRLTRQAGLVTNVQIGANETDTIDKAYVSLFISLRKREEQLSKAYNALGARSPTPASPTSSESSLESPVAKAAALGMRHVGSDPALSSKQEMNRPDSALKELEAHLKPKETDAEGFDLDAFLESVVNEEEEGGEKSKPPSPPESGKSE